MQKQKSWRVILLWIIYLAVSAVGFVMNVQRQDMQAVGMGVVALITPWIVPVVMRLCRLKMTEEIWIIDLLFTFFASLIGSCFGGYGVPFFRLGAAFHQRHPADECRSAAVPVGHACVKVGRCEDLAHLSVVHHIRQSGGSRAVGIL